MMLRDKRKDREYFENYIAYQEGRISKKKEKISDVPVGSEKRERINLSLLKYKIDMLVAHFSIGADAKNLKVYLEDAVNTICDMQKVDYESVLVLISVSIILSDSESVQKISKQHKKLILEDKLLNALSLYAERNEVFWNGNFMIPEVFEKLEKIGDACDKEKILLEYLFEWYDNHKDTSWYESDKGSNSTYVGYWSFESAALAKIFSVSENKLKQNIFYPVI